jgi:hypothetical protein
MTVMAIKAFMGRFLILNRVVPLLGPEKEALRLRGYRPASFISLLSIPSKLILKPTPNIYTEMSLRSWATPIDGTSKIKKGKQPQANTPASQSSRTTRSSSNQENSVPDTTPELAEPDTLQQAVDFLLAKSLLPPDHDYSISTLTGIL